MKRCLTALLLTTIVAAFPLDAAAATIVYDDVPVPGGSGTLARSLAIEPAPDRARFMFELTRLVLDNLEGRRPGSEAFLQHLRQAQLHGRRLAPVDSAATDVVPVPLTADVWGDAIFHRRIAKDELVYAIIADRNAALLCHGLASVDDQTLQYFADHSGLLSKIYEKSAPVFGAFAGSLQVHANRVVPPGGEFAVPLWEAAVAEKVTRPDRFVALLLEANDGRLAGLYDAIDHMDPPHRKFAVGDWLPNAAQRAERFRQLTTTGIASLREWHVRTLPFGRPSFDLQTALTRVAVGADGTPALPNSRGFWARVFAATDVPEDPTRQLRGLDEDPIDAAWIAETIESGDIRVRGERLEQLAFGQRVFGRVASCSNRSDMFVALRGLARFRMLVITLDRIGIGHPATYAAALRHAVQLGSLDGHRGFVAQAQFQGALALVTRMRAVRTLDVAQAQTLIEHLSALSLVDDRYAGAVGNWIRADLAKVIAPAETMELAVLGAMSGGASADLNADVRVTWEGQAYRLDLGASERRRLLRVREKQEALPLDLALDVAQAGRRLAAEGTSSEDMQSVATQLTRIAESLSPRIGREDDGTLPPGVSPPPSPHEALQRAIADLKRAVRNTDVKRAARVADALSQVADELIARVLLSMAYAADVGDPEGTVLLAGDVSHRHDFGFRAKDADQRARLVWAMPRQDVSPGVPWRVTGSLVGLDIALAPLALRRLNFDRVLEAPTLTTNERDAFSLSVALINPFTLRDGDRDRIVAAIDAGRRRLDGVTTESALDAIGDELSIETWRRRVLRWTFAHELGRLPSFFTLTDLLVLGGEQPSAFDAWGMEMVHAGGCVCSRLLPPAAWPALAGRPQLGLVAAGVADLHLQVAVVLKELNLPAALARVVLSAAVQDFVDEVRPIDDGDWIGLARAGRAVSRDRVEDYIAAATATGPLVPDTGRTTP